MSLLKGDSLASELLSPAPEERNTIINLSCGKGIQVERQKHHRPLAGPAISGGTARADSSHPVGQCGQLYSGTRRCQPGVVRHRAREQWTATSTRSVTPASRSPSSRSPNPSSTGWHWRTRPGRGHVAGRGGTRRRLQLHQPGTGHGRPRNPMINAGAIAADRHGRRAHGCPDRLSRMLGHIFAATPDRAADDRRKRVPVGKRHRPPQPRHRPHAAQFRHPAATDPDARSTVFPPMLDPGHLPRSGLMAATLANHGINPITGGARCAPRYVASICSA